MMVMKVLLLKGKGSEYMGNYTNVIIILIALLFIFGLLVSVSINTGYVGVKHQFGKAIEILPPGLHIIIPFVNSVNVLNMQVLKYSVPSSAVSKDLQMVTTTITVNYRIEGNSVMDIWRNFRGEQELRIIEPLTHETLKAVTAQYTASDLITKREVIKQEVTKKLSVLLKGYNIDVVEVSLVDFQFSEVFDKAIEEKMVAEQDKLKMQQQLEMKQIEVQKIVAQAEAEANQTKLNADANAYKKRVEADAEAYYLLETSFAKLEAINNINAGISEKYLSYWYIENWDGHLPQVITSDSNLLLGMNVTG